MKEFLKDLAEATPFKIIISQVIIWGTALIYTFRKTKKNVK